MDERFAERLIFVEATLAEMHQLATRGRDAYDGDIAVARACQFNVIRLASDLERLGDDWLNAHPAIPWRLIKGMRNRIAHTYWTIDDDVVWQVITEHSSELLRVLAAEIGEAHWALQPLEAAGPVDDGDDSADRS